MRSAKRKRQRSNEFALKRPTIVAVAGFPRVCLFIPITLLLLAGCNSKTLDEPGVARLESPVMPSGERSPIGPEVVRQDVEQHESWGQLRKAACPRRVIDRIEAMRPFHAINILEGLQYVTISDDTSRGVYEKVIELTEAGRRGLASNVEEEPGRYIIAIARREYLPGTERFEKCPRRDDCILVDFKWKYKPLNALGERIDLRAPHSEYVEHGGRSRYVRNAEGWKLEEMWLQSDHRDYVWGVYK